MVVDVNKMFEYIYTYLCTDMYSFNVFWSYWIKVQAITDCSWQKDKTIGLQTLRLK